MPSKNRKYLTTTRIKGSEVSPTMITIDIKPEPVETANTSKKLPPVDLEQQEQNKPAVSDVQPVSRCTVSKITGRTYRRPQKHLVSYTKKDS
ncbi:MAG: hypothetical protein AB4038_03345 [Prochloraceae cyanobacterium]